MTLAERRETCRQQLQQAQEQATAWTRAVAHLTGQLELLDVLLAEVVTPVPAAHLLHPSPIVPPALRLVGGDEE